MAVTAPSVGEPIASRCTKCRRETRHVIVSVVGDAAARVECTVCEGVHNYRSPLPKAAAPRPAASAGPRPSRPRAARSAAASAVEQEWELRVGGKDPAGAVSYPTAGGRLRSGDLLAHATFGLGVVRKIIPPNKIEVLFRAGIKRLVFGP
ncbi:MAG: hypothetical protein AB1578_13325 [Thermodesulfobacteriota bacterium]